MTFGYRLDVDYDKYKDLKLNHADKTVLAKLNKRERMCSYGLIITIRPMCVCISCCKYE